MAVRNRIVSDEELPALELKLFVCTDHDKHQNEAQVSSFVLAYDEQRAITLLDKSLIKAGLRPRTMWRYALMEVPLDKELAEVLNDGDY